MIALCKAGAHQINSQEAFNSSKFNWSLQLFLIRESRNVITSYWTCQTDPPRIYINGNFSNLLWSIMLARKLGLCMLQKSCCLSNLSKPFFLLPPRNLRACLSSRISSNEFQQKVTWVSPSPKMAAWSQKSRSLNRTYLCATFRYSAQVWTGTGLEPVTERCSEVKLPLLGCKCTLCATFCLPDLSCASSAARVGDTQTQLPSARTSEETDMYWWTITACHIPLNRGTITELCTSTKHTGEHHNIMQTFQRGYMGQKKPFGLQPSRGLSTTDFSHC